MKYQLVSKIIKCRCTKDYLFNKTDTFQGVLFSSGKTYAVSINSLKYKLLAVMSDTEAYVGMSIETFKNHFKFEKSDSEEVNNIIQYINKNYIQKDFKYPWELEEEKYK